MKKIQKFRKLIQLLFLILLAVGIYMNIRIIVMLLLPASLIFGNFFCGWVCPYGTIQDIFGKIGSKLIKRKYKMPESIQKYLQFSRYLIMVISMIGLMSLLLENINAYKEFMMVFDITNFAVTVSFIIMIVFLIIGIFFERAYCNYFCVEATKFGILSLARGFTFSRNKETCVDCKKCDKACQMNINISEKSCVRNGQCINCFRCATVCPVPNTLRYKFVGWKKNRK